MSFTLASRVSALGSAERVRAVYIPSLLKSYFIYTAKDGIYVRFYARELPPLVDLTTSAQPTIGSEIIIGDVLPKVNNFNVLALQSPGQVMVLFDDGSHVWRYVYDIAAQTMIESPVQLFEGTNPIPASVTDGILAAYLRDNLVRVRVNFGSERTIYVPSSTDVYSFDVAPKSLYDLNYVGAHSRSPTTAVPFEPAVDSEVVYLFKDYGVARPTPPIYDDQDLEVGPVIIVPSVVGSDPYGLPLTYSTSSVLPDGLTLDPMTGVISGDLTSIDLSKGSVTVNVSNGYLTTENTDSFWLFGEYGKGGNRIIYFDGPTRYRCHYFLDSDTLYLLDNMFVECLVVGGGGGGGMDMGGGGGGGGVVKTTVYLQSGTYRILVGAGGFGAPGGAEYRLDGAGPQPADHQFTIPAMNGGPSAAFYELEDDAYVSLLLNMTGPDNGTSFTDLSPFNNVISVFGGAKTTTAQSKFGGSSAVFDGNGDYLRTSPNAMSFGTENFTFEVWVRLNAMPTSDAWPTNVSSHMMLATNASESSADGIGILLGATKLIMHSGDVQIVSGLHGMTTGQWYHIAASRQGQILRLFVNGEVVATANFVGTVSTGNFTYIGSEAGQAWLNGYLSDLRVTKGICRYSDVFQPPTSQLTYKGGIVAIGGGAGGSSYYAYTPGARGNDGGSGGGTSGYADGGSTTRPGGRGLLGQGFNGGQGGGQYYSGGGGGAGGAGANSTAKPNGGIGVQSSILGTSYYWGGGGGGASYTLSAGGDGGAGGGGGGAVGVTVGGSGLNPGQPGGGGSSGSHANKPGGDGGKNTGGGGGGGSHYNITNRGGNGGSGIVAIRYSIPPVTIGIVGGTEVIYSTGSVQYKVCTFTSSGLLIAGAPIGVSVNVDYLIVGGGGGGGGVIGGGGGGGGVLAGSISLSAATYTVVVGSGGSGGFSWNSTSQRGNPGSDSSVFGLIALGGGGGGAHGGNDSRINGTTGGSGGGGGTSTGSAGTPGQGYGGGGGDGNNGGGGGGAGAAGGNKVSGSGGAGGTGIESMIRGVSEYFGGGGGGGTRSGNGVGGTGGTGGGGNGGTTDVSKTSTNGTANTGGGGGGGGHNGSSSGTVQSGGNGGSGIVIVRYAIAGVTKPVYSDQDLVPGPVSFGPTTPSTSYQGLPLTYSTASPLPASLSIDPTTGVISGNLDAVSTAPITVTVTDGAFTVSSDPFFICVAPSVPVYQTTQNLSVGPVSFGPTTPSTGPNPAIITYSTVDPLPASLSIDPSTGVISGNLDAVGTNNPVIVQVTNGTFTVSSNTFYLFDIPITVTSGTTTTYVDGADTYRVFTFTTNGSVTVEDSVSVDYLIVAGGGGGGGNGGGGGGGGGVRTGTTALSINTYAVTVGQGGVGGNGLVAGASGSNSAFNGIIALGGGGGASRDGGTPALVGGSGGGGGGAIGGGRSVGAAGTAGQGSAGGNGTADLGPSSAGGGGGGAGAVGGNAASQQGGAGGAGILSSITGTSTRYAGGGGGGITVNGTPGAGGAGGGGSGAANSSGVGTPGTGGGGGGASSTGGSGIVVIRYKL